MSMKAVVEIMGADPFGLREQCEQQCNEWLRGEPDTDDTAAMGDQLRQRFLQSIDQRTTGANRLAVTVVKGD